MSPLKKILQLRLVCLFFLLMMGAACTAFAQVSNQDSIYQKADKPPVYPYGIEMFLQYIGNNIKYRDVDFSDPQQRRVVVGFVVEQDGSVSNAKAIQGTNDSLNREAVRVVMASPKWEPGYVAGIPVRVAYTVPVPFGKSALHNSYSDEVYTFVDRQPSFPGGQDAFNKFVSKNIRNPEVERIGGIAGKVVVDCIVEKNGTLTDLKVASGSTEAMRKEAIRLLNLSPKWRAGVWEGNKFVRVYHSITIDFSVPDTGKK
ncbi:MAG: energy transducer TonB [Bacteroidota bacterium]